MKKVLLTAFVLLVIAGSISAQTLPSYVPANGLVGWWPFNGNANDESGNGNNGTVNGATLSTDRFGNAGKAYAFDGIDDNVNNTNQIFNSGWSSFSISIWAKSISINNPNNNNDAQCLFNTNPHRGLAIIFHGENNPFLNSIGNKVNVLVGDGQDWNFISFGSLTTNENFPINSWKHVLLVKESNYYKLYIDNNLQGSYNAGTNSPDVQSSIFFGNLSPGYGNEGFFGSLDDIAIWNRALSQQEITALYNASNCASDLSLTPTSLQLNSGSTASFSASTTDPNPVYRWQSDLGLGFQDLSNYGQYSGVSSSSLQVANLQLRNHQQKFRVISTSGNCVDTSVVATISLSDTCINVVNDTNLVTVTDTLIITITANPGLVQNTLKAYPNPTAGMLFINTGNYAAMPGYSIRIASATGQEVYNAVVDQPLLQVPLESLSPEGLFYLRLYDASGALVTTRKIVLQ